MRRRNNRFKIIKYFIISIISIYAIFNIAMWRCVNSAIDSENNDALFIISEGQSVEQISQNLKKDNLIKSKFCFKYYIWKNDKQTKLQAGEYNLNNSLTIKEIADALIAGRSLTKEKTIKIIEGWNIFDIEKYLQDIAITQSNEFSNIAGLGIKNQESRIKNLSFLHDAPASASLEGFLFPDTYQIFKNAATKDIIEKMLVNFDKKLTKEMRYDIIEQGKTIYEIITMASIVEKEVRTEKDMEIVAGIFWDRIKYGQPLQSCATLAYILGINKPQYTIEDTKIQSPYNTYQNPGLPPGPICNPGLNSIKAAIYPKFTEYNYFLSSQDGKTIFSKTFEEHNKNKYKYLR